MTSPSLLRKLAEAATVGPWRTYRSDGWSPVYGGADNQKVADRGSDNLNWIPDAAFIAAASPATILALLNRLDALEKVAEAANRLEHAASIVALADNSSFNPEANNLRFALDLVRQALSDLRKLNGGG